MDKLNFKQELFAQGIAKGLPQLRAYVEAGYKPSEAGACRLASHVKVSARIAELQAKGADKALVTVETINAKLIESYKMAQQMEQSAAMTAATMAQAKIFGLDVNKHEVGGTGGGPLSFEVHFVDD